MNIKGKKKYFLIFNFNLTILLLLKQLAIQN